MALKSNSAAVMFLLMSIIFSAKSESLQDSSNPGWNKLDSDQQEILRESGYVIHNTYTNVRKKYSPALAGCERNAADAMKKQAEKIKESAKNEASKREAQKLLDNAGILIREISALSRAACIARGMYIITSLKTKAADLSIDAWIKALGNFDFEDLTENAQKTLNQGLGEDYTAFVSRQVTLENLSKSDLEATAKQLNTSVDMLKTFIPIRFQQYQASVQAVHTTIVLWPDLFDTTCGTEPGFSCTAK
jgi:hypothetical protein